MDSNALLVVTLFDQYTHSLETQSWTFSICVYVCLCTCVSQVSLCIPGCC